MGTLFSYFEDAKPNQQKRTWPVRYFHQAVTSEDISASRFSKWDPRMHAKTLKYPAQEPAKDF
jgi:hypothetical protein